VPPAASPTIRTLASRDGNPPPLPSDRGLITHLERPVPAPLRTSPARAMLVGLLTAGLLPAWTLSRRLRAASRWRRGLADEVAMWLRSRGRDDAELARRSEGRLVAWCATIGSLAAVVAAFAAAWVVADDATPVWRLWVVDPFRGPEPTPPQIAFLGLVGASLASTWLGVNLHARAGPRLAAAVEVSAGAGSPRPGGFSGWRWGFAILATPIAAAAAYLGLTWMVPLSLAAVAMRRAVFADDREAARRMGEAIRQERERSSRPPVAVGADRWRHCPRDGCGTPLAEDARFCPRCGARLRSDEAFA